MSDDLFYDPAVIRAIRAILVSKGIRAEQDLEDAVGEVVLACIEYVRETGRPLSNLAEAIAIARRIAHGDAVDRVRKRAYRGKTDQGPTEDADQHAREPPRELDPVDKERMLSIVRRVLKDDQIAALSDVGVGVPQTELAAESGTSEAAMRKRTQKSRERALGALKANGYLVAGGFAALVGGVAAVLHIGPWRAPSTVGHGRPAEDERKQVAAEQRLIAADWCKERNWDECEKALDRAARIDAEGDRATEVSALRVAIAAGRRGIGAADGGGANGAKTVP